MAFARRIFATIAASVVLCAAGGPRLLALDLAPIDIGANYKPDADQRLSVYWVLGDDHLPEAALEDLRQEYTEPCIALGRAFSMGSGPWGLGIAETFQCFWVTRKAAENIRSDNPWALIVDDAQSGMSLTLKWRVKRRSGLPTTARITLPRSRKNMPKFSRREFSELLAADLLVQMKVLALVKYDALPHGDTRFAPQPGEYRHLPSPPPWLSILRVRYDEAEGKRRYLSGGSAELDSLTDAEVKKSVAAGISPPPRQGWRIKSDEVLSGYTLILQVEKATDEYVKTLHDEVLAAHAGLENSTKENPWTPKPLLDTETGHWQSTTSANLSLRYGMPIADNTILVSSTRLVNFALQLRGGLLRNLRLSADLIPAAVETYEGDEYNFAWQRLALGYSLVFEPGILVSRFDIVPRLGSWTQDGHLPIYDETLEAYDPFEFSFSRSLTAGLEAGAEWDLILFSLRLWMARDMTRNHLSRDVSVAGATSQRFGMDCAVKGIGFGVRRNYQLTVLGYYLHDSYFTNQGDQPPATTVSGEQPVDPRDITLNMDYLGLGIGITW